jgi:hypothetical protein
MKAQDMPVPSGQPDNQDIALAILSLAESIKAGQTNGVNDRMEKMLELLSSREEARPHENHFNPPMKSHYNPDGDRDFPRPDLKCQIVCTGVRLHKDCLTRTEIDLFNRLEPGVYRVTKADGRSIPFTVTEKVDEGGKRERLNISYPCKSNEERSNHLSLTSYLQEVLGETKSTEALRAQIEQLKQQLKTV